VELAMHNMDLDEFRLSGRQVPDIGVIFPESGLTGTPGYVYPGRGYVEIDGATFRAHTGDRVIVASSLEAVEPFLHEYLAGEGRLDDREAEMLMPGANDDGTACDPLADFVKYSPDYAALYGLTEASLEDPEAWRNARRQDTDGDWWFLLCTKDGLWEYWL
jgi:hypothetical protein